MRQTPPKTYIVVMTPNIGYILDAYPNELARCRVELGDQNKGEFDNAADASARLWELAYAVFEPTSGENELED